MAQNIKDLKIDKSLPRRGPGGRQPGAGRPKGSKGKKTIEKEIVRLELERRILKNADSLLNAQMDLAKGEKYLMVKITERGPKGAIRRVYHEIVTNPRIIVDYLDGELKDGDSLNDDEHYYYMTTKPANNNALQSLFERVLGKAMQPVDHTSKGEQMTGGFVIYRPEKLPDDYDEKMKAPGGDDASSSRDATKSTEA